ncbi:MAG: InlB B-repeat-containing protein [Candidatus Symbiothrix sp.]|nr:InlB B-repeat-containing protein [Candidatus Symbiothrix sp.]
MFSNVTANHTISVTFTQKQYTITTSSNPTAGGSTSGGGTYASGTSHTVTATANSSYTFSNWTENGNPVYYGASYTFTLSANRNLVANFTQSPLQADTYEPNNTQAQASNLGVSFSSNQASINTTGSNIHTSSDVDYYKVVLPTGYGYTVTPRLHDSYSSTNGQTYTVDAKFSYSSDGSTWSTTYDTDCGYFTVQSGGTFYFKVEAFTSGTTGTYLLAVNVIRTATPTCIITTSSNPTAGGSTSGGGTYASGTSHAVTATANSGYTFSNWTENGNPVYYGANYTFTVPETATRSLVANFTAHIYTVVYNGNGSTGGSTASSSHTYGVAKNLTANGFTKTGYTFAGWAKSATGTVEYSNSQSVSNLTETNNGTVTLYAKWVTVTPANDLCANATNLFCSATVSGTLTGATPTSIYSDGTLKDVFYKFTTSYAGSYRITLEKTNTSYDIDLHLFASCGSTTKLTEISNNSTIETVTYTCMAGTTYYIRVLDVNGTSGSFTIKVDCPTLVTFDKQNGTGGTSSVTATYGSAMPSATAPERTGYTFGGYYTSTNGSGTQYYTSSMGSARNWDKTSATTLYAKWTANTYTVVYNGNGSTGGSTASSSHTYDVAKNLMANGFTKTGYTFAGWATSTTGAVVYSNSQSISNLTATNNGTVTLYAKWTANTYTVVYNCNGGSGSTASSGHTYDVAKNLTAIGCTRTGYVFAGWATSATGAVVYSNGQSVLNLTATNNGTVNLYAIWVTTNVDVTGVTISPKTVTKTVGETVTFSATIAPNNATNQSVSYTLINGSSLGTLNGHILTCNSAGTITVRVTTADGNKTDDATITVNAAPALIVSPTFYNFPLNGGTSSSFTITSNQSWTISDDASWLTTSITSGSNNSTFTMTATANTSASSRSATVTVSSGELTRTISVTQAGVSTYAINVSANPSTGGTTSGGGTFSSGTSCSVTASANNGYTFVSWKEGSSVVSSSASYTFTVSANRTLVANFTANTYTVVYNGNGNTGGSTVSSSHTYDVAKNLTANGFTKTGYTFAGWATSATGAVVYSNSQSVSNLTATNNGTVTLYAKWTASTAITEVKKEDFKIYPNPAKNIINISGITEFDNVQISDLSGRIVKTLRATSLQDGAQTIDISTLPKGIYLLKIYTDKGMAVSKVVKE